ncbi:SIR2 family NAD-dependent protein deacylase [Psychroflexus maritimus]|uniref:NAD-dependent protein deacylase n=1 Tax=Psychroflexus maritimus TaxID=2714865 RepID=A0A967DZI1_9FLAO|nr:NAD-dependent deacylase [Psychroflexus maritimus]NGZ89527.1 NAD-dependent deacylase [Psychroflexus maritimus]
MKKLVVLTGAGVSAESGVKTFRDDNGLWEGHDVIEVATPEGFASNPQLVLDFYNQRRRQLKNVKPNLAHQLLADLEKHFKVEIVTQNVDDLHERAGSSNVTHLHGELMKVRSIANENLVIDWDKELNLGDLAPDGNQLRPFVVWFGEAVPMMEKAMQIVSQADILLIIGTSMQVYPAAGLIDFISQETPIYFIDPNPSISKQNNLTILEKNASTGMQELQKHLINTYL